MDFDIQETKLKKMSVAQPNLCSQLRQVLLSSLKKDHQQKFYLCTTFVKEMKHFITLYLSHGNIKKYKKSIIELHMATHQAIHRQD